MMYSQCFGKVTASLKLFILKVSPVSINFDCRENIKAEGEENVTKMTYLVVLSTYSIKLVKCLIKQLQPQVTTSQVHWLLIKSKNASFERLYSASMESGCLQQLLA